MLTACRSKPDGFASYISHKPSELEYGIRWIARTGRKRRPRAGFTATAEHKGFTAEKEKGNIKIIPAGGKAAFSRKSGPFKSLREADDVARRIKDHS